MSRYRALGERIDRIVATGVFFVAFNLGWAGLTLVSANAGNLFISVVTADLVLLGAAIARSAWCALHAKLDELLTAVKGARSELAHAEDRDEAEIAELRR